MTLAEKLERSVRWSRAHRGDLDARNSDEDGEPICIICGEPIGLRTHGGAMPKTCADCREIHRAGGKLSRRKIWGNELFVAIERAAARFSVHPAKCRCTPYSVRRKRIEAAGTERVTTWRGRPCIGGGCAGHAEPITPAWDAPTIRVVNCRKQRKAKGGAK